MNQKSWLANPDIGRAVLFRDVNGCYHLLTAWEDHHTALTRLTDQEARKWLFENGHQIPADLQEGPKCGA